MAGISGIADLAVRPLLPAAYRPIPRKRVLIIDR